MKYVQTLKTKRPDEKWTKCITVRRLDLFLFWQWLIIIFLEKHQMGFFLIYSCPSFNSHLIFKRYRHYYLCTSTWEVKSLQLWGRDLVFFTVYLLKIKYLKLRIFLKWCNFKINSFNVKTRKIQKQNEIN